MGKDHKDEFNCFLPRAYFYHDENGNLWRTTKCYIKSIPVYKLTSTILFVVYVLILIAQIYVWLEGFSLSGKICQSLKYLTLQIR